MNRLHNHTNEKLFSCVMCKKGFSRKKDLNVHLRVQTKEKPYSCDVYNKRFSRKYNMNHHLRIHTDEIFFLYEV